MKKILIIAGEASGDKHGASLVYALNKKFSPGEQPVFEGIGGNLMKQQGVHLFEHCNNLSFLGFLEVIRHLRFIQQKLTQVRNYMVQEKPEAVILIDYPGFNMKVAAFAKKLGIPVIYYILPKVWAWGKNRVKKIQKNIDLPLSILPFEKAFYKVHNFEIIYVGNPSLETIRSYYSETEFIEKFKLDMNKRIISLLPGSRKMEIKSLLPVMLKTAEQLLAQYDDMQLVISQAENLEDGLFDKILNQYNIPHVKIKSFPYDIMKHSYMALVASGTASLETAIMRTPSVVLYKVNPLTYWIGEKVVNVSWLSLTNLILNAEVFPEYIQQNCTPEKLTNKLSGWLDGNTEFQDIHSRIKAIPGILGDGKASETAAEHIYELLTINQKSGNKK